MDKINLQKSEFRPMCNVNVRLPVDMRLKAHDYGLNISALCRAGLERVLTEYEEGLKK
ncbi:type II toxin-antitoxin system CcdA family antitoxin [Methanoplanus limicola]|uniref:Uncharacterized protein n=1 Tax=Methanoplanus limicola DSM 2279 TaxID=937775 RepID=H1Z3N5_9EURY|nr:hypothetical protein [Methanoplanus limicola]EHQ35634.1 hypothetical protein Metlim_1533 [Methanoplanus limicola DSM 2279]